MFNPSPDDEIWSLSFYGPRRGKFLLSWPNKGKVLMEVGDSPELVEMDGCLVSERDCYAAAAAKKQKEAMQAMKDASEFSARACGKSE